MHSMVFISLYRYVIPFWLFDTIRYSDTVLLLRRSVQLFREMKYPVLTLHSHLDILTECH